MIKSFLYCDIFKGLIILTTNNPYGIAKRNSYLLKLILFFIFLGKQSDASSRIYRKSKRNGSSEIKHADDEFYEAELAESSSCSNCKSTTRFPNSIADKINFLKGKTTSPYHRYHIHTSRAKTVPKESERIAFSQKYNPDSDSKIDGFVPVSGPYGTRTVRLRQNTLKLPVDDPYKTTPSTRRPSKRSHDKNRHTVKQMPRVKYPQTVQRRAQYRHPKIYDELAVKESISSENILGNGNFEIIRGGIFSDQDANEILGSRRISRGFGSYIMPTYRQSQNRYTSAQNIQFPPLYPGRMQNPVQPMFYPRAPF